MLCPKCGNPVRNHERHCAVCDADVGYPNVRAAQEPHELAALEQRVRAAQSKAEACGAKAELEGLTEALNKSQAVLCRSLHQVMSLVSSDNELYATFYSQVSSGSRRPEETVVERERLIADNLLFPHYHHEIRFAALSLDCRGVRRYGACALTLTDLAIRERATVFEKNSVEFCREHRLGAGKAVLPGFRARWQDRAKLGVAKCGHKLEPRMEARHFARLVLDESDTDAPPDFIEVHIYGPLHRRAVQSIVVRTSSEPSDEALVLEIERRADEFHARVLHERTP